MNVQILKSVLMTGLLAATMAIFAGTARADYTYAGYDPSTNLNFEIFQKFVEDGEYQNIEKTLEALSQAYPRHFEKYVLMYKSRSLQQSSYLAPRAILFDSSAQFVFSFNGDPKHRGYHRIEIMQFRPDQARFEFREVVFPRGGGKPSFSEANPKRCLACHQSSDRKNVDPRPNWEPYNIWPGAYGSFDGGIGREVSPHHAETLLARGGHPSVIKDAKSEYEMVRKFFFEVRPKDDRYQWLKGRTYRPNRVNELTQFLGNLNAQRVLRIASEDYADIFAFAEWPLIKSMRSTRCAPETPGYSKTYSGISSTLESIFDHVGISTADWSMDFKTDGALANNERFGVPSYAQTTFWDAYLLRFGDRHGADKMSCEELSSRATQSLREFKKTDLYLKLREQKALKAKKTFLDLKNRCTKCHMDDDPSIPFIDFENEKNLKKALLQRAFYSPNQSLLEVVRYRLSDTATDLERMPLGPIADRDHRKQLVQYFEGLVGEASED